MKLSLPKQASQNWFLMLATILVVASIIFIYTKSLACKFYFDDFAMFDRVFDHRLTSWKELVAVHTRWVAYCYNYLTVKWFGLDLVAFRFLAFIQVILLGVSACYLYFQLFAQTFSGKTFETSFATLYATWLFLIHPMQLQTTLYLTQLRFEGLATWFVIVSLIGFVWSLQAHGWHKFFALCLQTVAAVLAIGTKESAIVLPLLAFGVDWWWFSRWSFAELASHWREHLLLIGATWGTFWYLPKTFSLNSILTLNSVVMSNRGNLLTERYETALSHLKFLSYQPQVLVHYLKQFIWPFSLSFDYGLGFGDFWSSVGSLALISLLGTFLVWLVYYRKFRWLTFGAFWFFVALGPRLFVPSFELVADYKTFLSSFGIHFIFGLLLARMMSLGVQKGRGWLALTFCGGLIFAVTGLSAHRVAIWADPVRFWQEVVAQTPTKARAYNNLGVAALNQGNEELAIASYKRAIALDRHYAEPCINLGGYLYNHGRFSEALSYYELALQMHHEPHPELYFNCALIWWHQGLRERAEQALDHALQLRSNYEKAWYHKALWQAESGNFRRALELAKQGLKLSREEYREEFSDLKTQIERLLRQDRQSEQL